MDFQQLIQDSSILDFVRRHTMHQCRMDLVHTDFLAQHSLGLYLDFRYSQISKCIWQYRLTSVYIVYLVRMVMGCMDSLAANIELSVVNLQIQANRSKLADRQ